MDHQLTFADSEFKQKRRRDLLGSPVQVDPVETSGVDHRAALSESGKRSKTVSSIDDVAHSLHATVV